MTTTYIVKPSDSKEGMWGIAKRHRVSFKALLAANPSVKPKQYIIKVGQKITIPTTANTGTRIPSTAIMPCQCITLTSSRIADGKKISHGAPVARNFNHDNGNFYTKTLGTNREFEPIYDLNYFQTTVSESDLLEIKLDLKLSKVVGNVTLSAISGAGNIRIWMHADKGTSATIMMLPASIPVSDLPKKYYIEGLVTGQTKLKAEYTLPSSSTISDELLVNVIELIEKQNGVRKVIYEYNTDIEFTIDGAPPNYSFEWDLNGDGTFNSINAESGKTSSRVVVKYGAVASNNTVQLIENSANTRAILAVAVKMTGGFVLNVRGSTSGGPHGMRIALGTNQGTALPPQSTAGLHTLFRWSDVSPIRFDANRRDPRLIGANRISYDGTIGANAEAHFSGVGASLEIYMVKVGPAFWTDRQVQEDLQATVNHEIVHLQQLSAVRDDPTSVWRMLDNYYGGVGGYTDFLEAESHLSELLDNNVSWRHHLPAVQNDLAQFTRRYNACLTLLSAMPAGPTKRAARQLVQSWYRQVPFFEMKHPDYDHYIRAPI